MNLAVVLALLAALANGAASVLQRRAVMEQSEARDEPPRRWQVRKAIAWLVRLLRRPVWLAGAAALGLSAALQAGALAVGSLSVVQPLMATELLFTLLLGTIVFRQRPGGRTWLSFLMLAVGLGLFLGAAGPSTGNATGQAGVWLPAGLCVAAAVAALVGLGQALRGAPSAAVLGLATSLCFACTAALVKEVTGRVSEGVAAVLATGYLYAACAAGLLSLLLLQSTLRAGSLAASQPALTLGDALVSVALGKVLFDERVALDTHPAQAVLGACLLAAGTVGLSLSPAVAGNWDATTRPPRPPARRGNR
ncbi:DMT family transporter [Streptomyces sp. NBC_01754]|uniref:DMT family transporter n=1 Tax=Streptomyces sp. NBC_01754 TaxID=2975930 RepID=UPI002DD7B5BE|nr:DMT family transporter [Streptomyces sp. NBC_01754]WSC96130.1 DMT family transporter [Streptomyces sp. NBC_01754]